MLVSSYYLVLLDMSKNKRSPFYQCSLFQKECASIIVVGYYGDIFQIER